jgi:hypothetical protein
MNVHGEMQEWLNWPLSKSGVSQDTQGSNPCLSAKKTPIYVGVFLLGKI